MTVFIFPGQGSQIKGMGKELFDEFNHITQKADDILGYSIKDLCLNDASKQLNQTQFTQPAIYTTNALMYMKKVSNNIPKPSFLAGHSLGEYNALLAANVFDFETGLKLVKKRGELMSQASNGAMAAVIGLKSEIIKDALKNENLNNVVIANYNSYTQIVISGSAHEVHQAMSTCENLGAQLVIPLKVSGAFHSPHMKDAEENFTNYIKEFEFTAPTIQVLSNYTTKPYNKNNIIDNITNQITHSVRWVEIIEYLINNGETEFEEIGPGTILTGLLKRIKDGK
ncbi:ACP S-malonyltransferase [Gammaproteobacteria bacterium]|nr:ACP S-malonyltransferase [Gammaproteobacteria bacterium]